MSHVEPGTYTVTGVGGDWDSELGDWLGRPGRWDDAAEVKIGDQTLEAYYEDTAFGQPAWGGIRGSLSPNSELRWESKQLNGQGAVYVDHVWPIIDNPGAAEIFVSFGWQEGRNDPITWSQAELVTEGQGVDVAQRGRYFSIRFQSQDDRDWSLAGFDIDYREAGRYGG